MKLIMLPYKQLFRTNDTVLVPHISEVAHLESWLIGVRLTSTVSHCVVCAIVLSSG
jgi:hypothetical protein